jgi:hypothetical protein
MYVMHVFYIFQKRGHEETYEGRRNAETDKLVFDEFAGAMAALCL